MSSRLYDSPYEPLHALGLRTLTKETLFLVALTTARCVGKLLAISFQVAIQEWDVVLAYLLEFRAKTEAEPRPIPMFFLLKSLTGIVGQEKEKCLLCPVRTVRYYFDRGKDVSSSPFPVCPQVTLLVPSLRMSCNSF